MTWLEPYFQNNNVVDIYTYSDIATVYPDYIAPPPIGLNPNNYTLNQTVNIDNQLIAYSANFSGACNSNRILGSNGGMYCNNGRCKIDCPTWPYCKAFFHYAAVGAQQMTDGCNCLTDSNMIFTFPFVAEDGGIRYPTRLINPLIPSNAQYWNNANLWFNVFANGSVLIENDGPPYGEPDGYEYLISVGHPITTSPCDNNPHFFTFFDSDINQNISREFVCPCVAWTLPHGVFTNGGWSGDMCGSSATDPLAKGFSNDGYRLWVMKSGQEPLPNSIKRHKLLLGGLPKNQMSQNKGWPVYDLDSHMRVSKYLIFRKEDQSIAAVPDRTETAETISYRPFKYNFYISIFNGQGDDGHPTFTITQEDNPETIFVGWNYLNSHFSSKIDSNICGDTDILRAANVYGIDENTKNIKINQNCDPGIFNPTSISDYNPEDFSTDPAQTFVYQTLGAAAETIYKLASPLLTQYQKPQIVFYTFPGEIVTPNIPEVGTISDLSKKYPLKDKPYLSRESINTIFENSNIIGFEEQRMLQSAELNELQEKFYKNQSLDIQFYRNWLTTLNLIENPTDMFGVSGINFSANNTKLNQVNTITSSIPSSLKVFEGLNKIYNITIGADYYRTFSYYNQLIIEPGTILLPEEAKRPTSTVDYINVITNMNISTDLASMEDDDICLIIVDSDTGNIITTNEYPELKDNTGGTGNNAPRGASRNLLRVTDISSRLIKLSSMNIDYNTQLAYRMSSVIQNAAGAAYPPKYLLAYAKKENGVITFYHSNGIKIQY
jgi:hypothetical protein